MAGFIDEAILDEILGRADIVDIISAHIPLKKSGRNFKACCPFHREKTASFMVSADKQIYHCFGCGAGGNAFNFLMQYERMEFPEAVEFLAHKTGVILPERRSPSSESPGIVTQIYKINEIAAEFYGSALRSAAGKEAHRYLDKRGITPETARTFRLGLARDGWDDLARHLAVKKIDHGLAEKAGLLLAGQNRGYYDRFRNRIVFPISDARSNVLGFGARVLDQSLPKYINSPETPVYVKGNHLYGLDLAKEPVKEADRVVVVEGYLDCIMPYQAGMRNIVASLGTALTPNQARLLKRYTHNVCLVYDGDMAGQAASIRSLDIFIDEGINLTIAVLPQGLDPDSFVKKNGIGQFKDLVDHADTIFDYKLKFLTDRIRTDQVEGKARVIAEMLPTIARFKNAVMISEYIKKLSGILDVEEAALREEARKVKTAVRPEGADTAAVYQKIAINPTEQLLIKLMLEETAVIDQLRDMIDPEDFQDSRTARIVQMMLDITADGKILSPNVIVNRLGSDDTMRLICESTFLPDVPDSEKKHVIEDCIHRLKRTRATARKQRLQAEIKKAQDKGDHELLNKLFNEFHRLTKKG
ncbi:MAG: DNA primase [Candidatus Omnitrophota bacterium]